MCSSESYFPDPADELRGLAGVVIGHFQVPCHVRFLVEVGHDVGLAYGVAIFLAALFQSQCIK